MILAQKVQDTVAFANKLIKSARDECAEVAERVSAELGEPAVGHAIAQAINNLKPSPKDEDRNRPITINHTGYRSRWNAHIWSEREEDEAKAKARLIAAAPDLLEALERTNGLLVLLYQTLGGTEQHEVGIHYELNRAAIRKATL